MPQDKMSQDKTPPRQIVTGQNVTQTKCHRIKRHADKMSQDKMPLRQHVTGQNTMSAKRLERAQDQHVRSL